MGPRDSACDPDHRRITLTTRRSQPSQAHDVHYGQKHNHKWQPNFGMRARGGIAMAQLLVSWLVSQGRFRVYVINGIGRRKGRIVEVEEVDTGERFHGSARKLDRLVRALCASDLGQANAYSGGAWQNFLRT